MASIDITKLAFRLSWHGDTAHIHMDHETAHFTDGLWCWCSPSYSLFCFDCDNGCWKCDHGQIAVDEMFARSWDGPLLVCHR